MQGWSPAHAQHPALLPVLPLFQELNCRTVSFRQGDLRYVRQVQAQELFPRVSVLRYDEALAEQYHIVALDFPLVHEDAAGVEVFAEKNATVLAAGKLVQPKDTQAVVWLKEFHFIQGGRFALAATVGDVVAIGDEAQFGQRGDGGLRSQYSDSRTPLRSPTRARLYKFPALSRRRVFP